MLEVTLKEHSMLSAAMAQTTSQLAEVVKERHKYERHNAHAH